MVNNYCSASCRDDTGGFFFIIMFGVKESRQPIKGEFAKKLIAEVQRMIKLKKRRKRLVF